MGAYLAPIAVNGFQGFLRSWIILTDQHFPYLKYRK